MSMVKIQTSKKIEFEEEVYQGLDMKNGNVIRYALNPDNIEKIRTKDKQKSTLLTLAVVMVPSTILAVPLAKEEIDDAH